MLKGKSKKRDRKAGSHTVFSGKLICGRCYGNMTKSGGHKGVEYYACPRCRTMGRKGMTAHSDFLEKQILEKIAGRTIPESLMPSPLVSVPQIDSVKASREDKKLKGAQKEAGIRGQMLLADYEMYAEGLITREEYEERRKALHEKAVCRETDTASQKGVKIAENTHTEREKEVFGGDSRLTFEVVDYYVEKIVVNGTEDIKIEWREGRQQQVLY